MKAQQQHMAVRPEAGFTLIEVLVAIAIVMVVGGAATLGYFEFFAGAQRDTAVQEITNMAAAVQTFHLKEGRYPRESEWPTFLTEGSPKNKRPYIDKNDTTDPWGNEYVYKNPSNNSKFDIISYGEDGQPGGEGDAADLTYRIDVKGEDR